MSQVNFMNPLIFLKKGVIHAIEGRSQRMHIRKVLQTCGISPCHVQDLIFTKERNCGWEKLPWWYLIAERLFILESKDIAMVTVGHWHICNTYLCRYLVYVGKQKICNFFYKFRSSFSVDLCSLNCACSFSETRLLCFSPNENLYMYVDTAQWPYAKLGNFVGPFFKSIGTQ